MEKINKDIKEGTIRSCYLLYGAEDYLKRQYCEKIVHALVEQEDTMNYNLFSGAGISVQEVTEIGTTLPFFAENRVIVIENSGFFKKMPEGLDEKLLAFPESTHVIFVEKEVDKRNRLYKCITKNGYACQMDTPTEAMLVAWIRGLCKAEGKRISDTTIYYFVEHMGSDMLLLRNELEKLFCYQLEAEEITTEDVKNICVTQATDKIFAMLDAIGSRNQKKALLLYHDLLALREPAMRILYWITRHIRILLEISALSEDGKSSKEMVAACKIQPFTVKKYIAQAKGFSYEQLRAMLEQCQQTDQNVKTGRIQDVVGVELLIVGFSE